MSLNFYSNFVVNLVKLLLFFYVMNNKFALIIYLIYMTIITKLQNYKTRLSILANLNQRKFSCLNDNFQRKLKCFYEKFKWYEENDDSKT